MGKYKGLGDGEKSFIFADGTKCWNGPHRSIRVDLECGAHNEIVKVSEPSVCEYAAVMITPLVCDRAEVEEAEREYKALTGEVGGHDELGFEERQCRPGACRGSDAHCQGGRGALRGRI